METIFHIVPKVLGTWKLTQWIIVVMAKERKKKVKINRIDNERQRISMTTGKVIPKPQESMQRVHPVTAAIGPKDTLPSDVLCIFYVLWIGY